MKRARLFAAFALLLAVTMPAMAQDTYLNVFAGVDVTSDLRDGRRLFNLHFLDKPVGEEPGGGLGPLFNRNACSTCHPRGGRGAAPEGPDEPLLTALVRLSVPGRSENGGPLPHPRYGGQLNTRGLRGVPAEARVEIAYETIAGRYSDGTVYELRRPIVSFAEPVYGTLDDSLTSLRVGQPVYGLGLLEAVSSDTIEAWADPDDRDGDGISGRVNQVWSVARGKRVPGRFGWKANEPDLVQQTASAFLGDIGITTPFFPDHDCGEAQKACLAANSPDRELTAEKVVEVADYLRSIAPPSRREGGASEAGQALFVGAGCGNCHRPGFGTVISEKPYLNGQRVDAYTDLLLHDMGEGLADGRPDFDASGREWRTPPLWGLGLVEAVHGRFALLHDGRARSIEEAILWHGGEAEAAREAFRAMSSVDRATLVDFLRSL